MEYENKMLKFKNKDYIKKLLDKYNFLKNRKLKKESIVKYTINILLGVGIISGILGAILINKSLIIGAMLFILITTLNLVIFGSIESKSESRQLEIFNDEFVEDVRANPSILQDLFTLVVDESSKDTFISLTDIILSQEKFPGALDMLIDILEHSPDPIYTFAYEEKRNKLMKNLNIDLNIDLKIVLNIKEDVSVKNKVSDKQENKQRLLSML